MTTHRMRSRPLGRVELDADRIAEEAARIARLPADEQYSEYTIGTWRTYVLFNPTGDENDSRFRGYEGKAVPTRFAAEVPYLRSVLERTLHFDRVLWVRAFLVQDGVLLPHRDFVEFSEQYTRIHLPIQTDPSCLHIEEDVVFHMRMGELWFLDATTVHGAASLSSFARISIVVDTADDCASVVRGAALAPPEPVALVERDPCDARFRASLVALGGLMSRHNHREVLSLLARVPYYKRAHAAEVFEWLIEAAQRSGDERLHERSVAFRRFCIEGRAYNERFEL